MNYDYIDRISELVSLNTFRKAVSQLEGDYLSSYRNAAENLMISRSTFMAIM